MKRRLKRIGRWLLRLSGVGLVLGLAGMAYLYDYPRVAADLPEAALAYRDAGLPWTAQDLAPNPPIRLEENAAPLLREAMRAWPHRVKDGTKVYDDPIWKATLTGEVTAPSLTRLAPALELAHEALQKPRLDFGWDWDLGQSLPMPEYAGLKAVARTLAARAVSRSDKGDDVGTLADLEDARRLGQLVASEPSLYGAFTGAACERFALEGAQACLVLFANDPGRLARYRDWLARPASLPDLNRALRGELYEIVATLRNLDRDDSGGLFPDALRLRDGDVPDFTATLRPLRREGFPSDLRDRAYLAECLRRWTDLAERTHGLTYAVDRIGQEAERIEADHQGLPTATSIYEGVVFPIYRNLGQTNHRTTALRALTLALADALIEHARTGHWPAYISVPDPLGEGTLRTRVDEDGRFRVWSVGDDGRDDGGVAPSEATSIHGSDLVAAYPPIPHHYPKVPPQGPPPGY